MNYYEDGPAAIKADHECTYDSRGIEWCPICYTRWPCEVYRIADRIEQQDDNAQNSRAVTVTINTEYLTIGDAAKLTGYSIKTLRRWADDGKVRAERSPGGHRLINRDDVNALPRKEQA